MNTPADQQARAAAIDPERSVIVQAPAGSGKTGLLVRRFLVLLTRVEAPEQILAITFTRKATAEMRQRVLNALQGLSEDGTAESDPELLALGGAALEHEQKMHWQLLDNSQRIRIQTIDSFCSELVRRMPWSARFGAPPVLLEDGSALHEEAASNTLDLIENRTNPQLADDSAVLIELLDGNRQSAVTLLAGMLNNRDQWMRSLSQFDRDEVEGWWRKTIEQSLDDLGAVLTQPQRHQLADLAQFAAKNLRDYRLDKPNHPASAVDIWLQSGDFPDPLWAEVCRWQGIVAMVLGKSGEPRGRIDVREGFPPNTPEKTQVLELIQLTREQPDLLRNLQRVQLLPGGSISDAQWRIISALLRLLPVAAAQLRVLFSERNLADYTELAQRADMALGRLDEPSDLALAMDYRLHHVLMDEFQDTSSGQIQLLEKLVSGWEPGDGRSAFFVGDPMQSIYRFREAEVGIFMDVQDRGLGSLRPQPATLVCNFRSAPALVDWFNDSFIRIMPAHRDIIHGAVNYTLAVAFREPESGCAAYVHAGIDRDDEAEARQVVEVIESCRESFPDDRIAVLGKARSHLTSIIAELDRREVPWQGIKLQKLAQRQAIQDLLALTLALLDPADRSAWLGVLRGPWLGASLTELSTLFEGRESRTILAVIRDDAILNALPSARRDRFVGVGEILHDGVTSRAETTLRCTLESCWLRLGGPAAVSASDVRNCHRFIELIERLGMEQAPLDRQSIEGTMQDLYADSGADAPVQLLTIHGSKGLEFDTVVLPGLHRTGRGSSPTLLRWKTFPDRILVAPRPTSGEDSNPFFDFLGALDKEHQQNESGRLLYVACTRARRRLHLFASVGVDRTVKTAKMRSAPSTSLLNMLWPAVETEFEECFAAFDADQETMSGQQSAQQLFPLNRLSDQWRTPITDCDVIHDATDSAPSELESIEFDWARNLTRITGIVVHRIFEEIDRIDWNTWCTRSFTSRDRQLWRNRLARYGIAGDQLDLAEQRVEQILESARQDATAAWIFSADHRDIKTEWAISGLVQGRVRHIVIDRSFVDSDGVRWIIDFKSGGHDSSRDVEQFLDSEGQRYARTMKAYAQIVSNLDQSETRTVLYYPSIQKLIQL